MSMSEPLIPRITDPENAPTAAEPGPAAPGTPLAEEPDVRPDGTDHTESDPVSPAEDDDPPFRTPNPGERLTARDLADES
jgi:hypothetical protein